MTKQDPLLLTTEIEDEDVSALSFAELERALTPAVQRQLLAYARRREHWLVSNGVRSARGEAAAWVADAISDTALGDVVCPPSVSIEQHLRATIRGRTARILERAERAPHASIDDPEIGGATREELIGIAGTHADTTSVYIAVEQTARVVEYVEREAVDDPRVLSLLRAYQEGECETSQVLAATGMSAAEVARARQRLDRILARMPDDQPRFAITDSGTW